MRRFQYIAVILAFLPLTAIAQKNATSKLVIWADGEASSLIGKLPQASAKWGGGGGLGLGYEIEKDAFIFQMGLGARYTQVGLKLNGGTYTLYDQRDSQGFLFNYVYEESKRNDTYDNISMLVPVMFGAKVNSFYFLVGAKAQMALYRASKSTGYYSTLGDYKELIDPFEDMPNHKFFVDKQRSSSSVDKKTNFNVLASAEIGAEFALGTYGRHSSYMRVAAFADFAILDCHKKTNDPLLQIPASFNPQAPGEAMIEQIFLTDYMHSSVTNTPIRQLMAGVKLTFLISGKAKSACVICNGSYPTNTKNNQRKGTRIYADW